MFSFFKRTATQANFDFLSVDIHSHLLPGLDDGSPDVATSVNYITTLHELGFDTFICTPHIFMEIYPNNKDTIMPALLSLQQQDYVVKNNITIGAAAEYMVNYDFDALYKDSSSVMVLPDNYILIEMSYLAETPGIENYIFDLKMNGFKPILAHPERYKFYISQPEKIQRFKDMGCMLQLNLLSVTGYYGQEIRQFAINLLKKNLYDFAGTDFHNGKHKQAFQSNRIWNDTYKMIRDYPFMNKEIFTNNKLIY